jgi:hypothetical protein
LVAVPYSLVAGGAAGALRLLTLDKRISCNR